ncbi:glycosyltransferase family 2 protein [Kouleothrix sp.]|uniref:glycosyltransferase family 2 protein n=1 Tax=Kouleothrix sp. TaxID=2779161 RepID=UPI00391BBC54
MIARIAVVLPAYNEASLIGPALQALRAQTLAPAELIVVDNGSTDATALIARRLASRVIHEPARGCVNARQRGFAAASAPFVATTDADAIVPPDWLERIAAHFAGAAPADAVYGPVRLDSATRLQRGGERLYLRFVALMDRLGYPHFNGANFAVRRAAFDAIGGFRSDMRTYSDLDLALRLRGQARIVYDPALAARLGAGGWHRWEPSAACSRALLPAARAAWPRHRPAL